MLRSLTNRINRFAFNVAIRNIMKTTPLVVKDSSLSIVSMLRHRDVIMYIIAIKSLYRHIGSGKIHIIDDGSLLSSDYDLLERHIDWSQVIPISTIDTGGLPRGNTWERLAYILDLVGSNYAIQMDADTLTLGAIDEVVDNWRSNKSFTLGEYKGQHFMTLADAAESVANNPSDHINIAGERAFAQLAFASQYKYVRGSSGFAGFSKGCSSRQALKDFSESMSAHLGQRWEEWGTEQIASNFVVANSPDASVLPSPKYTFHAPNRDLSQSTFVHFIGEWRFHGGTYSSLARKVIEELA